MTTMSLFCSRVVTANVGISSLMSESSVPSVNSLENVSAVWCLPPALYNTSKLYYMRPSRHPARLPVASAKLRIHFRV